MVQKKNNDDFIGVIKRAKSTTEYIQKDTNVFEPYENGGKLDNKITDSDGNDITPAPQD